jgi:hypothetical protein
VIVTIPSQDVALAWLGNSCKRFAAPPRCARLSCVVRQSFNPKRFTRRAVAVLLGSSGLTFGQLADIFPSPDLSPERVVQFQVEALRHNDDPKPDAGIEKTFRFASPTNKLATGPLEKFTKIVRSPTYAPMLNSLSTAITWSQVEGREARVAVAIEGGDGAHVGYLFILSKQMEGEFRGCWMTDGVIRVDSDQDASPSTRRSDSLGPPLASF